MAPYKSGAQRGYFHWLESKGKLPKSIDLHEWDEASKGKDLPEHVPEHWKGGPVEEMDGGHEKGWKNFLEPHDSAGEPHTEEDREDEQPEEYMSHGGRVKKMAQGGFAQALRMRRR